MPTKSQGPITLDFDALPDAEHFRDVWNLVADASESAQGIAGSVLRRVNGKSEAEVTPELVGRLAVFARNMREEADTLARAAEKIELVLEDLLRVADGEELDEATLDEFGKRSTDWMRFWRDDVSDALGIPRVGGAYGPELAKRIAAKWAEEDDDAR